MREEGKNEGGEAFWIVGGDSFWWEDTLEQHVLESRERRGRRSDRAKEDFFLGRIQGKHTLED